MKRKEYMKARLRDFPPNIIEQYGLMDLVTPDGYVYVMINKGMYGLKNAAILAYDNLKRNLEPFGYYPIEGTTGMWGHKTLRTRFCLCVDDFGLKFYSRTDAEHFLKALGTNYKYTVDWSGTNYYGLTFE
jgi:hypothetical protein